MKKHICVFAAALMVMCAMPSSLVHAKAAYMRMPTAGIADLQYDHADTPSCTLSFNGSVARCTSEVQGKGTISKIVGTQYLEKWESNGWHVISSKNVTTYFSKLKIGSSVDVSEKGAGDYRVRVVATVYTSNDSEVVEGVSGTVNYSG